LYQASVADTTYGAFAALALLAGAWIDDAWDGDTPLTASALFAIAGGATIAHDFFMQPEGFAGVHVLEGIKWPPLPVPPYVLLVLSLAFCACIALAVILPARAWWRLPSRGATLTAALGVAFALSGAGVFWIIPEVSRHLSFKQ